MKIITNNDYRIDIELSGDDLKELDITYDELDYSNIETRRVLWTVLDCARKSLGRSIDISGKMLIEAQPACGGGCVLGFTLFPQGGGFEQGGKVLKRVKGGIVFEADSADALLDAAFDTQLPEDSEMYERNGKYRVILQTDALLPDKTVLKLREFGEVKPADDLLCAFTREHWKSLHASDADVAK